MRAAVRPAQVEGRRRLRSRAIPELQADFVRGGEEHLRVLGVAREPASRALRVDLDLGPQGRLPQSQSLQLLYCLEILSVHAPAPRGIPRRMCMLAGCARTVNLRFAAAGCPACAAANCPACATCAATGADCRASQKDACSCRRDLPPTARHPARQKKQANCEGLRRPVATA